MTIFDQGPAGGVTLLLRRVPIYLRVARDPYGKFDALDQLGDVAKPTETLFCYQRTAIKGSAHLCLGGSFPVATYSIYYPQPDDATMRDTKKWQDWCCARVAEAVKKEGVAGS